MVLMGSGFHLNKGLNPFLIMPIRTGWDDIHFELNNTGTFTAMLNDYATIMKFWLANLMIFSDCK